ncbi:MAG: 1-acyl-sn-glycerol-3-phosphate acyltransferase [Hyphomonadaceae bacterium]|jgi:1-acyl-sn-glycerol-3-phosphate acyltransferase|nr:1-acyl-sn-glycerol-3-phosphate acyltransferase [Hyphomonadaceae bacterium]
MLQGLRRVLMVLLVRPVTRLLLGGQVDGREHLPMSGPAILAANHNSHIDTLVLLCLFPTRLLARLRPVAAADHFLKDPVSSWFFRHVVGIIPLQRHVDRAALAAGADVLGEARAALTAGDILIVFPEGTRGAPETLGAFKTGIARLAEACPHAPVIPVYLQGAGRALPRDEKVFLPVNVSVIIGEPVARTDDRKAFVEALRAAIEALKAKAPPLHWD